MKRYFAFAAILAIAGCATTVATPTQTTSSMVRTAQDDIRKNLRDRDSAQFGSEFRAYSIANGETAVCGTVNAKNGFGGYTGAQPVLVNYRPGRAPIVWIEGPAAFECGNLAAGLSARP